MSDFARFAQEFRCRAVTEARVAAATASLASRALRFGPYGFGPLASVEASGTIGTARVRTVDATSPSFAVTLPATLDLAVRLGASSRLRADLEIDLVLTPRAAADLYLYIDAAPVRAADVRVALRGRGLGAAVSGIATGVAGGLPSTLTEEVRRQVARQITNLLRSPVSRRARTVDIAARIDGVGRRRPPARLRWVTDDEFGREFVTRAVSVDRVAAGFGALAGRPLTLGPLRAGPGGLATVRATGAAGTADVVRTGPEPGFEITLPLRLDLVVGLGREHHYAARVSARLRAVARPAENVRIVVEVPPLTRADVTVTLTAADRPAAVLGRVAKLEEQLGTHVVRTVNDRIADADTSIDVAAIVGGADRPRPGAGLPR